jgi:hypothetical protein
MVSVHLIVGVAVLVGNLAAGAWGAWSWWRDRPQVGFWYLLRAAQAIVVLQVIVGSILVLSGHQAVDDLHYVYGVLPLVVTLLAEGARAGVAERELTGLDFDALPVARQRLIAAAISRRETGIMSVSALVVFLLALRAAGTSSGLF